MQINIDSEQDPKLAKLLERATQRLQADPRLAHPLNDGTLKLSCPLPSGYKPSMNPWASRLSARINAHWRIFEISEESESVNGGWMASCIPPPMFRTFLSAWVDQPTPQTIAAPLVVGQLELFQ